MPIRGIPFQRDGIGSMTEGVQGEIDNTDDTDETLEGEQSQAAARHSWEAGDEVTQVVVDGDNQL